MTTQTHHDIDRRVVRRALDGDAQAVRLLVRRLTPVVQVRVARALLRRRAGAKGRDVRQEVADLVQDTFVSLFENGGRRLRQWDPARGLSLEGFAGMVAEHVVASTLRSGRRNPWTEDPTDPVDMPLGGPVQPHPERVVASREQLDALLDALRQRLSPLGFDVFERLYVHEQSVADICRETGLSRDAVYQWRSRLRRLAAKLAAALGGEAAAAGKKAAGSGRGSKKASSGGSREAGDER